MGAVMNLKYYLRGLGLGIVMTAIIMGITTHGKKENLTEEEIVERAKELGMIEDEQLEEYLEKARTETEERVRKEIAEAALPAPVNESQNAGMLTGQEVPAGEDLAAVQGRPGAQEVSAGEEEPEGDREEPVQTRETGDGEEQEENPNREDTLTEEIIFTVKRGETPYSIGKRLEEEGLLSEDANFDRFMVDNGYDTKVVASEYKIPAGADMETIAKIITKQK